MKPINFARQLAAPQALTTTSALMCTVMPEYVSLMFDKSVVRRIVPLLESLGDRIARLTRRHVDYLATKDEPKSGL